MRESAKFELARLKKEEEDTFATVIHDTGSLLGQENTRRRIVSCHKGLLICRPFLRFGEIWEDFLCIGFNCVSVVSLHIESTDSIIYSYINTLRF